MMLPSIQAQGAIHPISHVDSENAENDSKMSNVMYNTNALDQENMEIKHARGMNRNSHDKGNAQHDLHDPLKPEDSQLNPHHYAPSASHSNYSMPQHAHHYQDSQPSYSHQEMHHLSMQHLGHHSLHNGYATNHHEGISSMDMHNHGYDSNNPALNLPTSLQMQMHSFKRKAPTQANVPTFNSHHASHFNSNMHGSGQPVCDVCKYPDPILYAPECNHTFHSRCVSVWPMTTCPCCDVAVSKVAVVQVDMTSKTTQRSGKWTKQEEKFVSLIVEEFDQGTFPLANGTPVRLVLAKLLNCSPMRLSKKFQKNALGKRTYRVPKDSVDGVRICFDQQAHQARQKEFSALESLFRQEVVMLQRKDNSKHDGFVELHDLRLAVIQFWVAHFLKFAMSVGQEVEGLDAGEPKKKKQALQKLRDGMFDQLLSWNTNSNTNANSNNSSKHEIPRTNTVLDHHSNNLHHSYNGNAGPHSISNSHAPNGTHMNSNTSSSQWETPFLVKSPVNGAYKPHHSGIEGSGYMNRPPIQQPHHVHTSDFDYKTAPIESFRQQLDSSKHSNNGNQMDVFPHHKSNFRPQSPLINDQSKVAAVDQQSNYASFRTMAEQNNNGYHRHRGPTSSSHGPPHTHGSNNAPTSMRSGTTPVRGREHNPHDPNNTFTDLLGGDNSLDAVLMTPSYRHHPPPPCSSSYDLIEPIQNYPNATWDQMLDDFTGMNSSIVDPALHAWSNIQLS